MQCPQVADQDCEAAPTGNGDMGSMCTLCFGAQQAQPNMNGLWECQDPQPSSDDSSAGSADTTSGTTSTSTSVAAKCSTIATTDGFCGQGKVYDDTKAGTDCASDPCVDNGVADVAACCKVDGTSTSGTATAETTSTAGTSTAGGTATAETAATSGDTSSSPSPSEIESESSSTRKSFVKTNTTAIDRAAALCKSCNEETSECWKCSIRCTVCVSADLPDDAKDADGNLCSTCSVCDMYKPCSTSGMLASPGPSADTSFLELSGATGNTVSMILLLLSIVTAAAALI